MTPDPWVLAIALSRSVLYFGTLASLGLVLTCIVFNQECRVIKGRIIQRANHIAFLALLALGAGFSFTSAALFGEFSRLFDTGIMVMLWQTPLGKGFALTAAAFVLLISGLYAKILPVAAAGGLLALYSFTATGHIADFGSIWLKLVLITHLATLAFWVGILAPLQMLAKDTDKLPLAATLGRRFGQIARWTVPVLIVAGVIMAWQLIGSLNNLISSVYGWFLIIKVSTVTVLIGAAAFNKLRFIPAMSEGDQDAAIRLCQSIKIEKLLFMLIFLLTALLTTVPGLPTQSHME